MKVCAFISRISLLLAVALFLVSAPAFSAFAGVQAKAVVLMEMATGRILYQQNPDMRIAPASLTKVLTVYTALTLLEGKKVPLETKVTVSKAAASPGGSVMGVKAGEKISIDDLLYGIAVASGNDASQALAEYVSGSHAAFVKEMNRYAKNLGMSRSIFKNAHGLPADGQLTTAKDMALLARGYLRDFPEMLHYHSTRAIRHNGVVGVNKNPFVGSVDGVDGLKSGWVNASGYNLITTAQRNGRRLILVVLGAPTPELRAQDTIWLLEAGFASLESTTTVMAQMAMLKPSQYNVSLPQARQAALLDLSRPTKVSGSIGSSRPAPVTAQAVPNQVSASLAMAAAAPTRPNPAPSQTRKPAVQATLVVGSIGSPTPAAIQALGGKSPPLTMAAR